MEIVLRLALLFAVNLAVASIGGTLAVGVLSDGPSLVLARDIAGVPVVLYALLSTAAVVGGFTTGGIFLLSTLSRRQRPRYYVAVLSAGAAGALFGVLIGGFRGGVAGLVTGTACGILDVAIWRPMRRELLALAGIFLTWPAIAQPGVPEDVTRFIERRDACEHFRGEAPYDAERRQFLEQQTLKFCAGTDKELAQLRSKYRGNHTVTTKLDEYEAEIEGPPPK